MKFNDMYKAAVDELQPSSDLQEKIMKREDTKVMKFNKKKVIILALSACMLFGMTVFATGHATTYVSWSSPYKETTDYKEAIKDASELGSEITIPEKFTNGFLFRSSNEAEYEGHDEAGNVVSKGMNFTATYSKDNDPDIYLFVNDASETDEESYAVSSKIIDGVEVYHIQCTYKFVSSDYELTEEDKKAMENSHYEISYGADQEEEMVQEGITFTINNKYYNMFAWNSDLTEDDWYGMAEEMLNK